MSVSFPAKQGCGGRGGGGRRGRRVLLVLSRVFKGERPERESCKRTTTKLLLFVVEEYGMTRPAGTYQSQPPPPLHSGSTESMRAVPSFFCTLVTLAPVRQKTAPKYKFTSEDLAAAASSARRTPSSRAAVSSALCAALRSRRSRSRSKRSADASESSCERTAPSRTRAARVSSSVDEVDNASALSCVDGPYGRKQQQRKYVAHKGERTHTPAEVVPNGGEAISRVRTCMRAQVVFPQESASWSSEGSAFNSSSSCTCSETSIYTSVSGRASPWMCPRRSHHHSRRASLARNQSPRQHYGGQHKVIGT